MPHCSKYNILYHGYMEISYSKVQTDHQINIIFPDCPGEIVINFQTYKNIFLFLSLDNL